MLKTEDGFPSMNHGIVGKTLFSASNEAQGGAMDDRESMFERTNSLLNSSKENISDR